MKKILAVTFFVITLSAVVLLSCEKTGSDTVTNSSTTSTCRDSAFLFADSIACAGKSVFHDYNTNKNIVMANTIPAIDTIVNGADFFITYDSIGTEACLGALLIKANITCYQRR